MLLVTQSIQHRNRVCIQLHGRHSSSACLGNRLRRQVDLAKSASTYQISMTFRMWSAREHTVLFGQYCPHELFLRAFAEFLQLCTPQAFRTESRHQEDYALRPLHVLSSDTARDEVAALLQPRKHYQHLGHTEAAQLRDFQRGVLDSSECL